MAAIGFENVTKSYGNAEVIHGVNLSVADRELMAFVGPSGCGKSTLLRMIAGLETVTGGDVTIGGRTVNHVEPRHRDIAMVFQDYALYPHKSVRDNMGFGLRMRGVDKGEAAGMVDEAARILQIEHLLDRKPGQLSGGQRQRVAMGRAIVRRPSAFLFDEPLSNLDAKLRVDMRMEIKRLHQLLKTTTVYVTHDQVEAMTLADRITVLRAGHIEQIGTPSELYDSPVNLFVASFIGSPAMNLFEGRLVRESETCVARFGDDLEIPIGACAAVDGSAIVVGIRPEHLERNQYDASNDVLSIDAQTDLVEPLGSDTLAVCRSHGLEILARVTPGRVTKSGESIELAINLGKVHIFQKDSGRRLR